LAGKSLSLFRRARKEEYSSSVTNDIANDESPPVALLPEERAAIADSRAAAARGEFATDEQVRAIWAKHGL
jgi:hypothetical protein